MAVLLADGTVMTCANFMQSTSGGVKFERHLGRKTFGYDGIGRIHVSYAKTDKPFWAHSANGTTKRFFLLYRAREWVEDLYAGVAEAIENEQ